MTSPFKNGVYNNTFYFIDCLFVGFRILCVKMKHSYVRKVYCAITKKNIAFFLTRIITKVHVLVRMLKNITCTCRPYREAFTYYRKCNSVTMHMNTINLPDLVNLDGR